MSRAAMLRAQLKDAHETLEQTMADVTDELANTLPAGTANSIGERYSHDVVAEDNLVQGVIRGQAPLMASTWAGRTGVNEPRFGTDPEHSRRVRVELATLRGYARAVYDASDAYLASASDPELDRSVDMSQSGFGQVPVRWIVSRLVIAHAYEGVGEIAAVKGVLGRRGLPF